MLDKKGFHRVKKVQNIMPAKTEYSLLLHLLCGFKELELTTSA